MPVVDALNNITTAGMFFLISRSTFSAVVRKFSWLLNRTQHRYRNLNLNYKMKGRNADHALLDEGMNAYIPLHRTANEHLYLLNFFQLCA